MGVGNKPSARLGPQPPLPSDRHQPTAAIFEHNANHSTIQQTSSEENLKEEKTAIQRKDMCTKALSYGKTLQARLLGIMIADS